MFTESGRKENSRTKFKNMSEDNLPRWTKFESIENSETLKSKNRIYISFTFFLRAIYQVENKRAVALLALIFKADN